MQERRARSIQRETLFVSDFLESLLEIPNFAVFRRLQSSIHDAFVSPGYLSYANYRQLNNRLMLLTDAYHAGQLTSDAFSLDMKSLLVQYIMIKEFSVLPVPRFVFIPPPALPLLPQPAVNIENEELAMTKQLG